MTYTVIAAPSRQLAHRSVRRQRRITQGGPGQSLRKAYTREHADRLQRRKQPVQKASNHCNLLILKGKHWGGRWGLNPRHPEPQSGATTN
jgi:hypothetical protein